MRYAVYFTPARDDPLTVAAQTWLGRDAFASEPVKQSDVEGMSAAEVARCTAEPRRYGFHATLVAPFRLRDGMTEMLSPTPPIHLRLRRLRSISRASSSRASLLSAR